MAVELIPYKWDDLDLKDGTKTEAVATEEFMFQGAVFAIDLGAEHHGEFLDFMSRLAEAGRLLRERPKRQGNGYKAAVAAAGAGGRRGRNSPLSDYNTGMREYFASIGQPIPHYSKKGQPDKKAGYKYKGHHYQQYNEYLRSQGREKEIMVDV